MSYLKKFPNRTPWYIVDKPRSKTFSTGTANRRSAEVIMREYEKRMATKDAEIGAPRPPAGTGNPDLSEVWSLYAGQVRGKVKQSTVDTHEYRWKRFLAWATTCKGGKVRKLRDVTVGVCNEYRGWIHDTAVSIEQEGRTAEQVEFSRRSAMRGFNSARRTLSAIWNVLIEAEFFYGSNPWNKVKSVDKSLAGEENEMAVVLSPRQVLDLFAALEVQPGLLRVAQCGYYLGARKGEILAMRWQDVDFDAGTVRLGGKQGRYRTIEVPPAFLSLLRASRGLPLGWVVTAPSDGTATKSERWNFYKAWRKVCKSMGLLKPNGDAIGVHDLRHSYATHLIEQGVGAQDVQRLLGHSTLRTTERYTHLDHSRNVTAVLDALVPGVTGVAATGTGNAK